MLQGRHKIRYIWILDLKTDNAHEHRSPRTLQDREGYRILVAGLVDNGFISTNDGFDKIVTAVKDFIPPGERQAVRVVVFSLVLRVLSCLLSFRSGRSDVAHPKTHISLMPALMAIHQLSAGLSRGPPRESNQSPFFMRQKNFSLTLLTPLTCIRESRVLNILSTHTDHTNTLLLQYPSNQPPYWSRLLRRHRR
jgi:hypothetical protein